MVEKTTLKQPLAARIKLLRGEPGDPYDDSTLRQEIADWEDVLQGEVADRMDDIQDEVDEIPRFAIEVVQTLPTTNISTTTIYLVVNTQTQEQGNLYDEYINLTGTTAGWEKLGTVAADVDLTDYYKKTETYNKTEIDNKLSAIDTLLDTINGETLVEVTGVSIDTYHGTSPEWAVGDIITLTATVTPNNATYKTVTWTSSDPTVISISTSGGVTTATVLDEGEATITCTTTRLSLTDSITVTATESIWSKIQRGAATLSVGDIIDENAGEIVSTPVASHRNWRVVHLMNDSSTYGGTGKGVILQMAHYVDSVTKAFSDGATGSDYNEWRCMDSISADQDNYYLRYYLNNGFYDALDSSFKAVIATASVPTCPNDSTTIYRTSDKMFAASAYEVMGVGAGASYIEGEQWDYYKNLISTATNSADSNRIMYNSSGSSAASYFLRSAQQNTTSVWVSASNGQLSGVYARDYAEYRVVPACLILIEEGE